MGSEVWILPGGLHDQKILGDGQMGVKATAAAWQDIELGRARPELNLIFSLHFRPG